MRRRAVALFLAATCAAAPAIAADVEALAARGAACFADRARGFAASGQVDPAPARCAAEAWSAAAELSPERLELTFRAVEALWFTAHFATPERAERAALLDRAVVLADRAVALEPRSGEARFWAAIAWGAWGLERGWLASATRGVPGLLREHAGLAAELAPDLRGGGGLRLLGRLHATLPRIPFVTGWVSRERGLELLRAALARDPSDPRNALFLAEALLDSGAAARGEALALLDELARRSPAEAELVEQSETLAAARRRLARERGGER